MLVGVTTTYEETGNYQRTNEEYLERVKNAGGIPVMLPPCSESDDENARIARRLIERLDALVLTGGSDIDACRYGECPLVCHEPTAPTARDSFELALAGAAYEQRIPTLGICRGMQVMNVARNGSLWCDIRECGLCDEATTHRQTLPYDTPSHGVKVSAPSLLGSILNAKLDAEGTMRVNSMHHQAVRRIGDGLRAAACSETGVIEAIESVEHPFYLGVQWHPEYLESQADLFGALLASARAHKG